jgi:hypothetical protein
MLRLYMRTAEKISMSTRFLSSGRVPNAGDTNPRRPDPPHLSRSSS